MDFTGAMDLYLLLFQIGKHPFLNLSGPKLQDGVSQTSPCVRGGVAFDGLLPLYPSSFSPDKHINSEELSKSSQTSQKYSSNFLQQCGLPQNVPWQKSSPYRQIQPFFLPRCFSLIQHLLLDLLHLQRRHSHCGL